MKKLRLDLIVLCFFLLSGYNILAQKVTIETTSLEVVNKRLEINYDFIKAKKSNRFEVWVEINNSKGEKISAHTFSGDIGTNLPGGKGKKIIWDYNADGIVIDEEVEVFINAKMSTVAGEVSTAGCMMKSLIIPGMGLSTIEKQKPFWIIGVAGYASLGSAIYFKVSSDSNYEKYKKEADTDLRAKYFDKAESQKSLSNVFTYTAIGTWTVSLIWTFMKAKQHNNSLANEIKDNRFNFYSHFDPISKKPLFGLQYKF